MTDKEKELNRIVDLLEKAPMKAEQETKLNGDCSYAFGFGYLQAYVEVLVTELKEVLKKEEGENK